MSRDINLPAGIGTRVGSRHDDAADGIAGTAEGMPEAVDGGLASTLLARIQAGVSRTASDLADLNTAAAAIVRDNEGRFGQTDAEVGSSLRDMTDDLEES